MPDDRVIGIPRRRHVTCLPAVVAVIPFALLLGARAAEKGLSLSPRCS